MGELVEIVQRAKIKQNKYIYIYIYISELSIFRQRLGKISVDLDEKTKAMNLFIEKPLKETNFDLNQSPLPKINYKMISELTENLFLVLRNKPKTLIYR